MRNINETLCYKWMQEVWNKGRRDTIDELLTADVIAHGLAPDGPLLGPESFKFFYDDFRKQFTNIYIDVHDVIAQDDMECVLSTVTGTHIPSGTPIKFTGQCLLRVKDGRIAEAWNHYDFMTMWGQLGYEMVMK